MFIFTFFHQVILGKKSFGRSGKLGQQGGNFPDRGPEGFFAEFKIAFLFSLFITNQADGIILGLRTTLLFVLVTWTATLNYLRGQVLFSVTRWHNLALRRPGSCRSSRQPASIKFNYKSFASYSSVVFCFVPIPAGLV